MDLTGWTAPVFRPAEALDGGAVRLERLGVAHGGDLHRANLADGEMWRFLPYGPFGSEGAYGDWVAWAAASEDPLFYAVRGAAGWSGVASYLRIEAAQGSIEIGHIAFAAALQRTRAATEAIHLMIGQAFDAGFRRVEWKCDAGNAPSRRAAARFGFTYEGTFRQHMVVKGRNRDTAWFAILDHEWPDIEATQRAWLDPGNFDAAGRQRQSLSDMTATG